MPKPMPPHGTTARFKRGCPCDQCRLAWNAYSAERRRIRKAQAPPPPPKPKRGPSAPPYRRPDGYVIVQVGHGRRKMQHRLVYESILGRELRPYEHIHHRNGVRHDNRPENLEMWIMRQPRGQRVEDLVTWAREILADYEQLSA